MPSPLLHQYLGPQIHEASAHGEHSTRLNFFYATTRPGSGPGDDRSYGNGSAERLQLGTVTMRRGDPSLPWDDFVRLSTQSKRYKKIPLTIERIVEQGSYKELDGSDFAIAINKKLASTPHKEITIYVGGAQSSFFKASARAAQLSHIMAEHGAFITFAWPSTGKLLTYDKDIPILRDCIPHFSYLLEWLARSTNARRINLFTYSAGVQIALPALASLPDRYPDESPADLRRRLRIGEVYLASPDISTRLFFTELLPAFSPLVDRTTFTYNQKDPILKLAERDWDGEARAGRPTSRGHDPEELAWLREASQLPSVDAIDMHYARAKRPVNFRTHGTWFRNPWVSSDLFVVMLQHKRPQERGLERKPDGTGWYFPASYPDRLRELCRGVAED